MNYFRGQLVSVKDYRGERLLRRVWEDDGVRVFITSDRGLELLNEGNESLWPIGVPREDVEAVHSEN